MVSRSPHSIHPRAWWSARTGLKGLWRAVALVSITSLPYAGIAQDADQEQYTSRFQATYIWQDKPAFPAQYTGPNSLIATREKGYTFSATGYFGFRPWRGAEIYWNPEAVQGNPLSHLLGLGGLTNAEAQKGAGPNLTVYQARAYLRQTWALGSETQHVEADLNQLAGSAAKRRVSVTVGNLSVIDVFDRNQYAADPRTLLVNWAFLTHGSFDYAANARGYSWGAVLEWFHDQWAVRAGQFLLPVEPNQQALDWALARKHGDQVEIEHSHEFDGHPGKVRALVFRNRAVMARYEDALSSAAGSRSVPDINAVRTRERSKTGFGVALEQELAGDWGVWARLNRSDGQSETYAFTVIDQAVAAGLVVKGTSWGRRGDSVGMGFARNGLSRVHQQYLASGGLDFFIGDGHLNYRPEQIVEAYYCLAGGKHVWITFDAQHLVHPGYNADRGPANVLGVRLHAEF